MKESSTKYTLPQRVGGYLAAIIMCAAWGYILYGIFFM